MAREFTGPEPDGHSRPTRGMRALILPKYGPRAASTRHRFVQFLPALEQAGIRCDVAPLFEDVYLVRKFASGRSPVAASIAGYLRRLRTLARLRRYDVVVIYFELLPYLPRWVERLVTPGDTPAVVDLDDAIFLQYEGNVPAVVKALYGGKISSIFADAVLVMAGNSFLAARARQDAKWVEVVPTVVDTDRYVPRGPAAEPRGFTIGWIGSPSTAAYLQQVAGPLAAVSASPGTQVRLVGSGPTRLPGVQLDVSEWSEATEVADINTFDVGIMPLPDTPWARGKCAFKLIEYMACGIPVIASPVGANMDLVEHGINGYLASTPADWAEALHTLRADATLRWRLGAAGRAKVEAQYSLRVLGPRLVSLLRRAAGETRRPSGVEGDGPALD